MSWWDTFTDAGFLNAVGTGIDFAGKLKSAEGTKATGEMARKSGEFTAAQLRINAGQAKASAQRSAYYVGRDAKYLESAALAAAAAGGGGASDPTVVNTIAQIAAEGAYRQQAALYEGEERGRSMEMQAEAAEFEGGLREQQAESSASAQMFGAGTTLLKGFATGASLYTKYGNGGPGKGNS